MRYPINGRRRAGVPAGHRIGGHTVNSRPRTRAIETPAPAATARGVTAVPAQPRSASCGTAGAMPSIQAAGEPVVGVMMAVRIPSFA